ncbi:hypothetical protein CY35_10G061200 [Sphagnum magellanicum]|nr:hypothetical protein CY35_10G061200 [Sphagnum magellanicum]
MMLCDEVIFNGKKSPEIDFHLPGVRSMPTHTVQGKVTCMPVRSIAYTSDACEKASGEEMGLHVVPEAGEDVNCKHINYGIKTVTPETVPLQEEQRTDFVKVIRMDEGNNSVQEDLITQEAQDMPSISESNASVPRRHDGPGSTAMGVQGFHSTTGTEGSLMEMEWFPSNEIQEPLSTKKVVCEQVLEDRKVGALVSVEMEIQKPHSAKEGPTKLTRKNQGSSNNLEANFEPSEALGDLKDGQDPEQEAESKVVKEETGNPLMDLKCNTNMEDENVVKEEKAIHLAKAEKEENLSMEVEDKGMIVDSKSRCTGVTSRSSRLTTQGGIGGESSTIMLQKAVTKSEGEFIRKEKMKGHRSSQHIPPESMVKKAKDSYSKVSKARKAAKVVKRNCISGTRSKRKHTDVDLMDNSGSSEEAMFQEKAFFGGIAAFTRQRTTRGLPAKRKRMIDGSAKSSAQLHVNTINLVEMSYKCVDAKPASLLSSPTANGPSKLSSKKSTEPRVNLSIKSFTVPELFVDLPETATVSSLKRAVMDAAMNLLGGGLCVRVLMQGKKVPDEAATLSQMGISRIAKPESLSFMLEPSPVLMSPSGTSEDPLLVLSRVATHPSPRYPAIGVPGLSAGDDAGGQYPGQGHSSKANGTAVESEGSYRPSKLSGDEPGIEDKQAGLGISVPSAFKRCNAVKTKPHLNEQMPLSTHSTRLAAAGALAAIRAQRDANRRAKNELELPSALPSLKYDTLSAGSGAMILHPTMGIEDLPGMALVPVRPKSCPLDIGKRRVRRPFSVTEVEALVHSVEKLGIGRWRDVKLQAFDQAKHRTYVDLKDKWKTLVHTARIAPHQRRGEPVPQELLERVTRAHTFWSAQAAKQQADLDL